ncbi:MAG: AmmeMemoRadiSam system protein A [Patescibacteria group bacterium]
MDPYVELATKAVADFVHTGIEPELPPNLPGEMLTRKAGIFVSIHKKSNQALRGCIGTFQPAKAMVALEIVTNAIAAAFGDPRFNPISADELDDLSIHVDVLSKPEQIFSLIDQNPTIHGLIVKNGENQSGLLLPDIGIDSAEDQFAICCNKGGMDQRDPTLLLYRFTVERHT